MPDQIKLESGIEITEYRSGALSIQRAPFSSVTISPKERVEFIQAISKLGKEKGEGEGKPPGGGIKFSGEGDSYPPDDPADLGLRPSDFT